MHRKTKLIILLLLSFSVYFIFKYNNKDVIKIVNIGDSLSQSINI